MGLLLDYDDAQVAREHYTAFRSRVISQLECDGPAACWHLPGEEIAAAMATRTDDVVRPPRRWPAVTDAPRELANRLSPRPAGLPAC